MQNTNAGEKGKEIDKDMTKSETNFSQREKVWQKIERKQEELTEKSERKGKDGKEEQGMEARWEKREGN